MPLRTRKTSLYLLEKLAKDVDRLQRVFNTRNQIYNAAVHMFANAPKDEQVRAMEAVADLAGPVGFVEAASDADIDVDATEQRTRPSKRRHA